MKEQAFEDAFVDCMRMYFGSSEVTSSAAYKQYTSSQCGSVGLSETKWPGFLAFLEHLQSAGKCEMRFSNGKCYVTMVSKKRSLEDEEGAINEQVERATKSMKRDTAAGPSSSELHKQATGKIVFSLLARKKTPAAQKAEPALALFRDEDVAAERDDVQTVKRGAATIKQIVEESPHQQEIALPWLEVGLIVRFAGSDESCVVEDVRTVNGTRIADVALLRGSQRPVKNVREHELHVVAPRAGDKVKLIKGGYRGEIATVLGAPVHGLAHLKLESRWRGGKELPAVALDVMCVYDIDKVRVPERFRHR